ncbi:MAG: helix-turn-helix transcriptional regulator [Clostridia bacterium]|nr:helix-turn-helix transcriptional regulator [Clostridia bacterium]
MKKMERQTIDWKKTGKNLQLLRNDNVNLRKVVCSTLNFDKGECSGDCDNCRYEMDSSISRPELAQVFNVSESVIFNWENGKTPVSVEDMLFYCRLADVGLEDIIVFDR